MTDQSLPKFRIVDLYIICFASYKHSDIHRNIHSGCIFSFEYNEYKLQNLYSAITMYD